MNDPEEKYDVLRGALEQISANGCIYSDCAWFEVPCKDDPTNLDWCDACVAAQALEKVAR